MVLETEPPCKKIKMPLDSVILRFAKLTSNALSPTRGSKLAAGYDLYRCGPCDVLFDRCGPCFAVIMMFTAKIYEPYDKSYSSAATRPQKADRGAILIGGCIVSAYNYKIPAKGKICAMTDIQIAVPDGCYGRVAPRSGLAVKHFIDVGAGVIDQDYRGNVGVVMFNFGEKDFVVNKGDRIAQLICERIYIPELEEVESLDNTERGQGGFGSTGTN